MSNLEGKTDLPEVPISDNVSSDIAIDKNDSMSDNGSESISNAPDDDDDHLLAKAIFEIENENYYKRPVGKSYIIRKRNVEKINEKSCNRPLGKSYRKPQNVENGIIIPKSVDTCSPVTSVSSSPSSVVPLDDGDDSRLAPLIDFINLKRDFLVNLVSDSYYSSNYHLRSERIVALKKSSSLKGFRKLALNEAQLIRKQMEPYVDESLYPFAPLHHIHFEILCEEHVPETMFDIKGKWPITMKIR